jgi:predicted SnoaL-like aldol condensation-catalyzing enzyme
MSTDETPLSVIRCYYDAWSASDPAAIRALLSDRFVGHSGAFAFAREDLVEFRTALDERFDRLTVETREAIAQDDRVAAVWTTQADDVEWHGISLYRVAGGRIVELWDVRSAESPVEDEDDDEIDDSTEDSESFDD